MFFEWLASLTVLLKFKYEIVNCTKTVYMLGLQNYCYECVSSDLLFVNSIDVSGVPFSWQFDWPTLLESFDLSNQNKATGTASEHIFST